MANLFRNEDRRVVPNWRSFGKTTVLGELNSFQADRPKQNEDFSIEEYVIDFELNKTVIHAAELLSAANSNNKREHKAAITAAKFVLNNSENSTISQLSLANHILNCTPETDVTSQFKEIGISSLSTIIDPKPLYDKIRGTKRLIRSYPFNAIFYVELSRYYSILGQENNAVQTMKIALNLAPNNRFILRSATRLFAHYNTSQNDYLDYIHRILRNSPMSNFDPWLASAEISISTIKGQNSRLIKKGIELINSGNISPFNYTELASSIGTVEMLNGSIKKSRELFNKSLISPNDNSLAQIEWASTKDSQLEVMQEEFEVKMNFEALALDNYEHKEYNKALDNAAKWFKDQPFSMRPIMFGSNLASTIMKDQDKSIAFLNAGLQSHPNNPQLINNLAYALALDNKPKEALKYLDKIRDESKIEIVTKICLKATKGLAYFRSGFVDPGRQLYIEAIEQSKKINNQYLNWIAILNYAREEILHKSEIVPQLMDLVAKIPENTGVPEIESVRNDVIMMHKKLNE
ncbi:MAG: hypothetical protein WD607_08240 [Candidatus Paceibacterota bacterium]